MARAVNRISLKVYSIHEPEVSCIAKGKTNKRYEFGNKVGLVVSAKSSWVLGMQSFEGNPYDGHTLKQSLEQAEDLTRIKIEQAVCDQGYRGHGVKDTKVLIVPRNKNKASRMIKHWYRRRNAIEPVIGHHKSEHGLDWNRLSGSLGDGMNALFSACGFNIKKLMRAFCAWLKFLIQRILSINSMLGWI